MIKGYVKKINYLSQKNIDDNDEDNYENIYFVIVTVVDNKNIDYKIKGDIIMKPECGDIIICSEYNINKDKYDNDNIYISKGLLTIKLPCDKKFIINRLESLKIKNFSKKKIEKIVDKHKENIWNIELIIDDDIITEEFKEKIINYKKSKNKFLCDTKAKYIMDYICETYNISLTIREYELIKKNINYKTISYPIKNEDYEKIILNITGYISQEKLLKICDKMKLSNEIKLKILIISILKNFINNGNTCIEESDLFNNLEKYEDYIELKKLYDINKTIEYLINNEYIVKYKDVYYDSKQYYFETNIAKNIKLLYDRYRQIKNEELNLPSNDKFNRLNDEQKKAYINAINCPLSIITGGPGFGKTSIIASVVDFIKDNNQKCIILGPTGKIVSKIKNDSEIDKSCCNIYTIHRFLNIKYREFHTENNDYNDERNEEYTHIKNSKFIIIDEMSMISNDLLSRFFDYIDKEELIANIIFIGDVKQLPSIEAGNTLSQLIDSQCIPKIKLQHSFRQKNNPELLNTIQIINEQKFPDDNDDYKFIKINNLEDCSNKLENLINDLLSHANYKFKDIIIITPTRKNISDFSDKIRVLHHKYNNTIINNNKLNNFVKGDYIMIKKNIYRHNEDIKYKKNNDGIIEYIKIKCQEDLFNGMVGYITDIIIRENKKEYYIVEFDNKLIGEFEYDFFNKQEINSMSYINTVHKYQGSENKIAIILITENDKYFADKKLIYTAISRAKEKCYVIGEIDIFRKAIKKNFFRKSKLENMIIDNCKTEKIKNINYNKNLNVNNDNIKIGIPTIGFDNIKYRSRIEAKWSYMFDYLKWDVKYEPFDLQGYIPDFILKHEPSGKIKNLLIEIKNEPDEHNFKVYYEKAINSGWEGALLLLNYDFEVNDENNMIILGKLYFHKKNKIRESNFYLYKNECGEYRYYYVYKKKYYNNINKECDLKNQIEINNNTSEDDILLLKQIWSNISNKTQYKTNVI